MTDGRSHGRLRYTSTEDEAMRAWVLRESSKHGRPQGHQLWKAAEEAGITRHGWMSMHNRWRRHIARQAPDAVPPPREAGRTGSERIAAESEPASRRSRRAASPKEASRARPSEPPSPARSERSIFAAASGAAAPQVRHGAGHTEARPQCPPRVAEMAADVLARLLKQRAAAAGSQVLRESDFDGKWFFGEQSYEIRGKGTDLRVGGANCHFKQISSKACELFIFNESGEMLHVVNGRLSADLRKLNWNNGREWVREDAQRDDFRRENQLMKEQLQMLRDENQRLREDRAT